MFSDWVKIAYIANLTIHKGKQFYQGDIEDKGSTGVGGGSTS